MLAVHPSTMTSEFHEVEVFREGIGGVRMLVDFYEENAALHAPVLDGEGLDRDVSGAGRGFAVIDDGNCCLVVFI